MIVLDDVAKTYRMGGQPIRALQGVTLTIERGDFVVFMGPSGSGKSTLLHILGCIDRPDAGRYLLDGKDTSALTEEDLARVRNRQIGLIHQNFNLLKRLTAFENVELPLIYGGVERDKRRERVRRGLDAVGLSDRANHHPTELSGGQQQRVAIARALVNDAPLLLADEPTGNLDSQTSVEIMTILQRLNQRKVTVVLITHDRNVAEWASHVYYIRDGKLGV